MMRKCEGEVRESKKVCEGVWERWVDGVVFGLLTSRRGNCWEPGHACVTSQG